MPPTVSLSDIIEAFETQSDESSSFLDLDTGSVKTIMHDYLRSAEESDEPGPHLVDWEKDVWEVAKRIVSTDRFVKLPTKYDIHEWEIMRDFANSAAPDRIRQELSNAIRGAGAFRCFTGIVRRNRIEQSWFDFRHEALKQIAIDWCEENDVQWR